MLARKDGKHFSLNVFFFFFLSCAGEVEGLFHHELDS